MTNSTASSPQTNLPTTSTPLVKPDSLTINEPWHRFFVELWKKVGSGQSTSARMAYLVVNSDGSVTMYDSATNKAIGTVQLQPVQGGAEEVQTVGSSPFTYVASKFGSMLVANGKVEIARSGPFYQVSLVGGYFSLEPLDSIRVTWYGAEAPQVVWFPYS